MPPSTRPPACPAPSGPALDTPGWRRRGVLRALAGTGLSGAGLLGSAGLLGAAGLLGTAGAAGCGLVEDAATVPAAPPDPLEPLIVAERALITAYDTVLAEQPDLAGRLGPLREAHRAHLEAVLARIDPRRRHALGEPAAGTESSPSETQSEPPAEPSAARPVPPTVPGLRAAERAGAARARAACLAAEGDRAALLGSIFAAERAHLVVLRSAG